MDFEKLESQEAMTEQAQPVAELPQWIRDNLEDAARKEVRCEADATAKMEYILLREKNRIRGLHLWSDDAAIDGICC